MSGPRELRLEDEPLLRGKGRYTADVHETRQAALVLLRAPMASASIRRIEAGAARRAPGVLAVLTGEDLKGFGTLGTPLPVPGRNGMKTVVPRWPALAEGRVVHAGQGVAAVVAKTVNQALDAAELIEVDYQESPAVADLRAAAKPGAPLVWPEAAGNVALDFTWPNPDEGGANAKAVEQIISMAPVVARLTLAHQRIAPATLEVRAATGTFDPASGEYTLRTGTQSAWLMQQQMAAIMGVEAAKLRVVNDDVGGAFGAKSAAYPEYVVALAAAKKLGRPVHWRGTRAEAFLSDNGARDLVTAGELALDRDGRFLALRVKALANVGAFVMGAGVLTPTLNLVRCFPSVYRIPKISCDVTCVFTHTAQFGPYRGAGRPEANYLLERLVEEAARLSRIDAVSLRRRNLIAAAELPYKGAMGTAYDSGDFPAVFEKALELADWQGFAARRQTSESRGKRRGFGISCFLEHSGAAPMEGAAVAFPGNGTIEVKLGAQSTGQGHLTVFRKVAAEKFGVDPAAIVVREGDTRLNVQGYGTFASRAASATGSALFHSAQEAIDKGKKVAAAILEAAEADIVYRGGVYEIAGTDRRVSLFDVAKKADLSVNKVSNTPQTFPNGCHVAEIEVDPDTGKVDVLAYSGADDSGKIINAMIVEGQVQGGVAQGIGQALLENAVYDQSGQLLAGSFMDYALPRADDMPPVINDAFLEIPCKTNPLGVKGAGEAGTTAALAAIMNALADALPNDAGRALDMPATPLKVWQACQKARKGR